MRVSPTVLASLLLTDFVEAFQPVLYQGTYRPYSKLKSRKDLHEFDHLFAEKTTSDTQKTSQPVVSRRRIHVNDERRTVFASSATMDATSEFDVESESAAARTEGTAVGSGQSSTEELFNPQKALLEMEREEKGASFGERMADEFFEMNFLGAVSSLLIPGILAFVGGRWMYNRISARLSGSLTAGLEEFADEMIYHDGDFEEMKLCYSDYSKKLSVLGPLKGQKMSKKYLELYAKKKTISPQAISSLSYVFSLFKLSEDKAADLLVSLCQDLGEDKISSVGKLLFFGSRILKSPEAKAALSPIKDMIKATYPDVSMADTMVDSSQQAMAEAAYRSAVIEAGEGQDSLTVGWEVLGLDKQTATRIFEEEAEDGFVDPIDKMYGKQNQKYDKKGRPVDDDGKLIRVEGQAAAAEEGDDEEPVSGVFECSECGYTLFVAKGRESKFFGEGFKCPECGAPKDKFESKDVEE